MSKTPTEKDSLLPTSTKGTRDKNFKKQIEDIESDEETDEKVGDRLLCHFSPLS